MAAAAISVHQAMPNFHASKPCVGYGLSKGVRHGLVRCCQAAVEVSEKKRTVVKNGNDSLEICRVLNGMWQTSGGWGRIDRDDAIEAMLCYADAGLSTFDMADHCMTFYFSSFVVNLIIYFPPFHLTRGPKLYVQLV